MLSRLGIILGIVLFPPVAHTQEPTAIRGFVGANIAAERDLEHRFQGAAQSR